MTTLQLDTKKILPWNLYILFFAVLNETVFNISTPLIAKHFSLSPTSLSWMMTIFLLFFGVGTIIFGRLSDLYSLRFLITLGIVIYSLGSLLGFLLQFSYPLILISRSIQGFGAAAIPALVTVVVIKYFPEENRGQVFGSIGSVASIAVGVGPILGGWVAGQFHWTLLFLIPLLSLLAIPFLLKPLPDEERKPGKIDYLGALLLSLSVGLFVIWLTYLSSLWLILTLIHLSLFLLRINRTTSPFIEPQLLRHAAFRNGVLISSILFALFLGLFFLLPLFFNQAKNLSPSTIGLLLFPGAFFAIFLGPLGGRLADKKGNRVLMLLGFLLLIGSLLATSFFIENSVYLLSFFLIGFYAGFAFIQTGITNAISKTLPPESIGTGMGLFNLFSIISGALGMTFTAKILESKTLQFQILPTANSYWSFQNLFLCFSLLVLLVSLGYFYTFKKETAPSAPSQPFGH